MPSGRKPDGDAPLSSAERQARYRLRNQVGQPAPAARMRRATDRRSRPQRWRDAVTELLTLQAVYAPGSRCCPTRFREPRPLTPCRPSSISISKASPRSSRPAVTAATDEF